MTYYKVTGKVVVTHDCNCHHCTLPGKRSVNVSVVVQVDDSEIDIIEYAAWSEAYRNLNLINETDRLAWEEGGGPEIREAYEDEIMAAIDTPRLPGF